MFSGILKYQGDTGEQVDEAQRIEIAQKLLHQGLKRPELKDELYMQLLKQTRGNPTPYSRLKAWELFLLVAASMPPSKVNFDSLMLHPRMGLVQASTAPPWVDMTWHPHHPQDFVSLVSEYIHGVANDESELQDVRSMAAKTWNCLKRSAKATWQKKAPFKGCFGGQLRCGGLAGGLRSKILASY